MHPTSGRTVWHLATTVSIELVSVELDAFAQAVGAGPTKQIMLVVDGAGWHISPQVRVPEHVHLLFLPPHSPELQPAEHLWPQSNTVLVNRHFTASRSWKTPKPSAASRSNNGPISSAQRRAFTGGPNASPNVEGQGGTDIRQRRTAMTASCRANNRAAGLTDTTPHPIMLPENNVPDGAVALNTSAALVARFISRSPSLQKLMITNVDLKQRP